MARTAYDEGLGVGLDVAIASNYQLRLPYGEGGVRFYVLRPSSAGLAAVLPIATFCQLSGRAVAVVVNAGAHALEVRDVLGTLVATIAVGAGCSFWLLSKGTPWGTWLTRSSPAAAVGTTLTQRTGIELEITDSTSGGVNLRLLARARGFTAEIPYAVRCRIRAGAVIGALSTTTPGLTTDVWPAGSTLLLTLEQGARICGRGGNGGRGGDYPPGLLAFSGQAGGPALAIYLPTALVSYGYVQGGGGGGGGGSYGGTFFLGGGGGGGGGAGWGPSNGGAAGKGPGGVLMTFGNGFGGGPGVPGPGGNPGTGVPAGNGGAPGAAGAAGATFGGAAGNAIEKYLGATLTKVRAGTIDGAEVSL